MNETSHNKLSRAAAKTPPGGGLGFAAQAGLSGETVSAQGVLAAIGGYLGIVESLLPATTYLVIFILTRDARLSVVGPVVLVVAAICWRLLRRQPLTAAFSGAAGVLICVAAVLLSGEGSSYFVPGFIINGVWVLAHTISLLVGWPLIGLLLGFLRGSLTEWRKIAVLRRAATLTTLFWILLFAARLAVQLPLFFAAPPYGDSVAATEALGLARLIMGVPLFALAVLFTWLVLARVSSVLSPTAHAETHNPMRGE